MADMMFALGQTKKKKVEENKVRQTKQELKDVKIIDTIEKDIRKEQHNREQQWKATGRDQIKKNTNFDMARSLFGGGSALTRDDDNNHVTQQKQQDDDEEVEEVAQEVKRLGVRDNDDDEVEEQQDDEEYEEEVVEDEEDED